MPNQRARRGWEQPEALRRPGRQRKRHVGVAAAGRMVVNADAIKSCILAACDECRDVRQRPAYWNTDGDIDPGHLTSLLSHPAGPSTLRQPSLGSIAKEESK